MFPVQKYKEYLNGSNLIVKLEAKHDLLKQTLGEGEIKKQQSDPTDSTSEDTLGGGGAMSIHLPPLYKWFRWASEGRAAPYISAESRRIRIWIPDRYTINSVPLSWRLVIIQSPPVSEIAVVFTDDVKSCMRVSLHVMWLR